MHNRFFLEQQDKPNIRSVFINPEVVIKMIREAETQRLSLYDYINSRTFRPMEFGFNLSQTKKRNLPDWF